MAEVTAGGTKILPKQKSLAVGDEIPRIVEVMDFLAESGYNKHMPEPFKKRERVMVSTNQSGVVPTCLRIIRMSTKSESVWFLHNFCKPSKLK